MFPKGFRVFAALVRANQVNDGTIIEGAPFPAAFLSRLLEEWKALPESVKARCETLEAALAQEKKQEHSLPQSSPHDPPPSVSMRKPPTKSKAPAAAVAPAATQHFSSSSPSTTPSPSTPLLSPSPFCSSQTISHVPQNLCTATPTPSQPEPLNTGDNWFGVRYGAGPEVAFLMENQPSHSQGGRQTTTKQVGRAHPYDPTTVSAPRLHSSQTHTARKAPLQRSQTVVAASSMEQTPSMAGVLTPGGNVVRRFHSVPSVVASSNTSNAPQLATPPINTALMAPSGQQRPHSAVLDRRFPVESVQGLPAVPAGARQPPPSSPYAGVPACASPLSQEVQTPIPGDSVYTPSAGHHVQTTPAPAAVPLPSSFDHSTPAQTAPATTTDPVAPALLQFDVGSSRPLSPQSFMDLMCQIPTPVPDVVDVDVFLSAILAPQFSTSPWPEFGTPTEDNPPLPDAFQIWPSGRWSVDISRWLNSDYVI